MKSKTLKEIYELVLIECIDPKYISPAFRYCGLCAVIRKLLDASIVTPREEQRFLHELDKKTTWRKLSARIGFSKYAEDNCYYWRASKMKPRIKYLKKKIETLL